MNQLFKYYRTLGLASDASAEQIKQAYHDLLWIWHPDRFENNPRVQKQAEEMIKEINNAYDHLKSNANITGETSRGIMESGISWRFGHAQEGSEPWRTTGLPPIWVNTKVAALLAVALIVPAIYFIHLTLEMVLPEPLGKKTLQFVSREASETPARPGSVAGKPAEGKRAKSELCVKRNANGISTYDLCSAALLTRGYVRFSKAGALLEAPAVNPQTVALDSRRSYDLTSPDPFGERERAAKKIKSEREIFEKIKLAYADAQRQFERHRMEHQQFSQEYQRRQELYSRGVVSRQDVVQAENALAQARIQLGNSQQWYAATESLFENARINDNRTPSP